MLSVMNKGLALVLSMLLWTSAFANNIALSKKLNNVFDNVEYSLSVEWDQKDPAFKQEVLKKFEADLRSLKEQGLTGAELLEALKGRMLDEKMATDLQELYASVDTSKIDLPEAQALAKDFMDKNYAAGSHWRGRAYGYSLAVTLLVLAFVVAIATADYVYVTDTCYWGYDYDYWGNYVYDCWYYY